MKPLVSVSWGNLLLSVVIITLLLFMGIKILKYIFK